MSEWTTSALRVADAGSSAPDWATFVGLTGVVLTLLLALARLSQSAVRDDVDPPGRLASVADEDSFECPLDTDAEYTLSEPVVTGDAEGHHVSAGADGGTQAAPVGADERSLSTGALLVNVAFTQGLFGGLLLAAAWYTEIPAWAFGITGEQMSTGLPALLVGTALGVGLYVANELGAASADAMGVEYDERLRSMLAPDTALGWLTLFGLVLPIIAGVEEFIFRAAIIGATTAGFGTSPWVLAVVSSLAFALGHGAQGRLGIVVTGGLGFVLAGAFIVTGSFLVVFVAHYLVNALEFAVHELLGIDWARTD
ncbi:CPBP family intramembrane glutamic endopeptidase [Halorientalis brevis]|uniref:CPBP family intramembrane glutamic endopeptidase n=1 Tax=Halorientalis brevis TaxID=1126241 RepID=A0ABD6CAN6_9EURY